MKLKVEGILFHAVTLKLPAMILKEILCLRSDSCGNGKKKKNGKGINMLYILSWFYFSLVFPISFEEVALFGSE